MPYRVHANVKGSALFVVVATAREALAKMAELMEFRPHRGGDPRS